MINKAFLCLGGNIGNRLGYIHEAIDAISKKIGCVCNQSTIYETEAWGTENQQSYLNVCIEIDTSLSAKELIVKLLKIEQELGRVRIENHQYHARTIDIDILFFNDEIIHNENLIIPHPRLHLRKFVLTPLKDIAGLLLHPILKKTITNLLTECPDSLEVKAFHSTQ